EIVNRHDVVGGGVREQLRAKVAGERQVAFKSSFRDVVQNALVAFRTTLVEQDDACPVNAKLQCHCLTQKLQRIIETSSPKFWTANNLVEGRLQAVLWTASCGGNPLGPAFVGSFQAAMQCRGRLRHDRISFHACLVALNTAASA